MEPISEPVQLGLGIAAAIFIIGKFLDWAPKLRGLLNGKSHSAVTAGEHTAEYWHIEQRKAVADVVKPLIENQNAILLQIIETGRDQSAALRELMQEIREDHAMQRGRREARLRK